MAGDIESGWVQFDLALARDGGDARPCARRVFATLSSGLDSWRERLRLDRFFFQRKEPDLRLRFRTGSGGVLSRELAEVFSALREEGSVLAAFPSVYEPETRLFGGPEAMELAHAHFETDSLGWIELDRLAAGGGPGVPVGSLLAAVWNDLFVRTLGDASEIWDAWANLGDLTSRSGVSDRIGDVFAGIEELAARLPSAERGVLARYVAANEELAEGLRGVRRAGRLECGRRGLLPFVAMFQANRHGARGPLQAAIAGTMARFWDPRRGLRGAVPTDGRSSESGGNRPSGPCP